MRSIKWLTMSVLTLVMVGCMNNQDEILSGLHEKRFDTTLCRDIQLPYLLYLPEGYETADRQWPLVLFLHGAGERGDDLVRVKVHGPTKLAVASKKFPFILLAPQCPPGLWWPEKSDEVIALVDYITQTHRVDTSRLYITGLSMGGFGTWSLITQYPDKFAAAVPICGGGNDRLAFHRLKTMPVWAFHGTHDDIIPVQKSQEMVDALQRAGNPNVRLTLYEGVGHDTWTETYDNPTVYDWLLSHSKE